MARLQTDASVASVVAPQGKCKLLTGSRWRYRQSLHCRQPSLQHGRWHRMAHVAKRTMPVPATWSSTRTSILTLYMGVARDVCLWRALRHPRRQAALARPGTAGCSVRVGFAAALDRIPNAAWVGAALQTGLCTTLDCFAIRHCGGAFLKGCE